MGEPKDQSGGKKNILDVYSYYLRKNPLFTKCCTSAVSSALGDFIAQMANRQGSYEYRRTVAFALFGFFGTGPITHNFYKYLAVLIKPTQKHSQLLKLAIERVLFSPAFLLLFLYSIPVLQGKGLSAAHCKVKESYWLALKANWRVWTLFQYINLNYIPQQYQTLFANAVALFWNIYLSLKQ